MKKIIRTAIVIALAGAALLSTGCTKDVSSDINALQTQVTELQTTVDALNAFKAEAQKQISENEENLASLSVSVIALAALIDEYETATDAQIAALNEKVEKQVTEIYEAITAVTGYVAALQLAFEVAVEAIDALAAQVDALAARITSIVAVPSANAEIMAYTVPCVGVNADTTVKVFIASFEVSPKAAAEKLTAEDLTLLFKEGVSKGSEPIDTAASVQIVYNYDGQIIVSTYAPAQDLAASNKLYYSLSYAGKDEVDATYYVQSAYTPAAIGTETISYAMAKKGEKLTAIPTTTNEYNDTVAVVWNAIHPVTFLSEDIVFAAKLSGEYYTMDQLAATLGIEEPKVTLGADTTTWADPAVDVFNFEKKALTIHIDTAKVKATPAKYIYNGSASERHAIIKCSYNVNGKAANVVMRKVATIIKETKKDTDVTAPISLVWNYKAATASIAGKKVAVPSYYNGKTEAAASKAAIVDAKGKAVSGASAAFSAANDTALISFDAAWPKEAAQYNYNLSFENDTLIYNISVPFNVAAKPADQKIALADSTVAWTNTGKLTLYNSPVEVSIPDTTLYKGDLENVLAKDIYADFTANAHSTAGRDSVVCDGKNVTSDVYEDLGFAPKAYIKLQNVKPGKTYTVFYHATVNGIKYSYTQNIIVKNVAYAIATDPLFVANDSVKVVGNVNSNIYSIDALELANYFKVDGKIGDDAVKMNFGLFNELGNSREDTLGIEFIPTPTGTCLDVNKTTGRADNGATFVWGNYTATTLIAKAWLTTTAGTAIGDTIAVKIVAPQAVKDFKAGEIAKDRTTGQDLNINLWENIFASSALADTNVFNPKASTLNDAQVKSINYGQVVSYDFSKATAEVNGQPYALDVNFTLTDGVLTVKKECGTFVAPLKIKIPAKVNYKYDYNGKKALTDNVVVTITQK